MNDDTRSINPGHQRTADAARRDYESGRVDETILPADSEGVAKLLVESFEPVAPDASVWDRIAADISRSGEADFETSENVVNLDGRRRLWPALFSVAAVFLAILGTVVVVNATSDDGASIVASAVYELTDPATGAVTMTVSTADDGSALATATGLQALGAGETYQLWSVVGDEVVSVGLLGSDPGDVPLRIEGEPAVLALTVEVAGGVAVSEATPVAVWQATG